MDIQKIVRVSDKLIEQKEVSVDDVLKVKENLTIRLQEHIQRKKDIELAIVQYEKEINEINELLK